jgi:truncated hemoglobin YjbI
MSTFTASIARWGELLQALTNARPGSPDFQQAFQSLNTGFAAELEAWLRAAHPFTGTPLEVPAHSTTAAAAAATGAVGRMAGLLNDWARLQSQLAGHWSTVSRSAAEKFAAQMRILAVGEGLSDPRNVFARWIDCAEEAYAETAHSEAFARLVADLTNTAAALQLEGRRAVQECSRAPGTPTRHEIDVLTQRIEQLEREVRRQAKSPRQAKSRRSGRPRAKGKRRR